MIILGIDPGTATTGFGFLEINNNKLKTLEYGLIETKKDIDAHFRLEDIYFQFNDLFKKQKPDHIAIEKVFFSTNKKTAISVGQAIGVILLSSAHQKLPVFQYAPGSIKKLVAGDGRADKLVMQSAVRKFLGAGIRKKKGNKTHFDNSADALAVAIAHALNENLFIFPTKNE